MPALNFHWRSFWWLVCCFIVIVPIGTLLHESAHYLIARVLGFEGYITYQSTIYTYLPGEGQALLDKRRLVTMAGPLQTMLTGLLGLAFLWKNRQSFQQIQKLHTGQWAMIFLSLFWLRQVMNICVWLYLWIRWGEYPIISDEVRLAIYLNGPGWLILFLTGIMGGLIVVYVYLKFIPAGQKKIFFLAGLTGCTAGYLIWFGWLGKILLPGR